MGKIYYNMLMTLAMLVAALSANAQGMSLVTENPGEVKAKLGDKADAVRFLSVEGLVDYSDIDFLRELSTTKSLEAVNLLGAVISSGTSADFPTFSQWPVSAAVYEMIGKATLSDINAMEDELGSRRLQDIEAIYEGILSYYNSSLVFYETTDPSNPYRYYMYNLESKKITLASLLFRPLTYAIHPVAGSNAWGLNSNFNELARANGWSVRVSDGAVFVFDREGLSVQLEVTAWRHIDENVYAQMKLLPKEAEVVYELPSPDLDAFGVAEPAGHIRAYEEGLGNKVETYGETSALGESYVVRFGDGTMLARKYQLEKGDYRLLSVVQEFEKGRQGILAPDNESFRRFLADNGFEDSGSENNVYYNKAKEIRLEVKLAEGEGDRYATMTFTSTHEATSGYTLPLLNFDATLTDILVYEGKRGSGHEEGSSLGTHVFTFSDKSEFARAVYEFTNDRLSVVRQFASSAGVLSAPEFAAMLGNAGFVEVSSDEFSTIYHDTAGKVAMELFANSGLMEFKKIVEENPGPTGGQVFEKDENGYFLPLLCFNVEDPMPGIKAFEESAGHGVSEWMDNMFTVGKAEPKRPFVDIVYVLTDDKSMLDKVIVGCSADSFSKGDFEQFMASNGFEKIDGADGFDVEQLYYNRELRVLAEINIEVGKRIIYTYDEQPGSGE